MVRQKERKKTVRELRHTTKSPARINFFATGKSKETRKDQTIQQKYAKIPLAEDENFLKAIKAELMGLRKRVRHDFL